MVPAIQAFPKLSSATYDGEYTLVLRPAMYPEVSAAEPEPLRATRKSSGQPPASAGGAPLSPLITGKSADVVSPVM